VKVVKGLPVEWGSCSRTVLLDSFTQTLSYWNNTVAAGSTPGDIIILDAITGSQIAVLSEHTTEVKCVTFSSDGTSLVSGSHKTIKLWDVQTGGVVKTFYGHTGSVWSVSISVDCTIIASVAGDDIIHLWNIQTGECYHTIQQQDKMYHVSFSPTNPQHLISICDNKICQWDNNGHQIKHPFNGSCIAFSPDGTQFVFCNGAAITVQNSDSGVAVAEFQVAGNDIRYCCFSPDSRLVAVAAYSTVYVWDITSSNPHLVETFIGHTRNITSLVFSSPSILISASWDKSVKFWQIGALSTDQVVTDPESTPITLPLISSISLQARDGIVVSRGGDGVVKTWDIPTGLCNASSKIPVKDYKHGDVNLTNSRLVFVWYADNKINIWDPEQGRFLLQADIPDSYLLDLRISGDGSKILWIDGGFIQAWDTWTGQAVGKAQYLPLWKAQSLAMEGSRVWMWCPWYNPRGWDFGIPGPSPSQLSTIPPDRLHLSDTKLWDISLCRIQDTVTGKVVFQFPGTFQGCIVEVQWNGQYLAISPKSEKEVILEIYPTFFQ
jgi:WD40 repeat protein